MKKLFVIIFTIFQIIYIVKVSYPLADPTNMDSYTNNTVIKTYRCCSLFAIVYDNTFCSIKNLAELSGLVSSLPKPKDDTSESKSSSKDSSHGLIPSNNLKFDYKPSFTLLDKDAGKVYKNIGININCMPGLVLLFLTLSVFLFLLKIKYFCLNARSNIDSISILFNISPKIPSLVMPKLGIFIFRRKL